MISFVSAQVSVKIRLACSKACSISSSNIITHPNKYIKSDKYFFFYKSRCGKCSPETPIFKARNAGTRNGMRGMRGTRGMFTRIPGNLLEDSGQCYYFNIPGNVRRDSGECLRTFRGMFEEIRGNVEEDSGECSRGFRGMF